MLEHHMPHGMHQLQQKLGLTLSIAQNPHRNQNIATRKANRVGGVDLHQIHLDIQLEFAYVALKGGIRNRFRFTKDLLAELGAKGTFAVGKLREQGQGKIKQPALH